MNIQTCARYLAPRALLLAFFLLGTCFACSCRGQVLGSTGRCGSNQALVTREINVWVQASYKDVLEKLNGVEPTTKMFASQDVRLVSYTPRKEQGKQHAGVIESTIDILGWSHEFGMMRYLMHIHATEKFTVIDVGLICPVDKLVGQYYRFVVRPCNEHACQIQVYHELHIEIERRRIAFINRIIERVTYKKSNEKIDQLTPQMAGRVRKIANQVDVSDSQETQDEVSQQQDAGQASQDQTAKGKTDQGEPEPVPQVKTDELAQLKVVVSGFKSVSGDLRIAIYNSQQQFKANDSTKPEAQQGTVFRSKVVQVTNDNQASLTVVFDDVPAGTYAIGAFHDINGNKRLDANAVGFPTEPYGFSRNVRGLFGPPKYRDVTIKVDQSNRNFSFNIK